MNTVFVKEDHAKLSCTKPLNICHVSHFFKYIFDKHIHVCRVQECTIYENTQIEHLNMGSERHRGLTEDVSI